MQKRKTLRSVAKPGRREGEREREGGEKESLKPSSQAANNSSTQTQYTHAHAHTHAQTDTRVLMAAFQASTAHLEDLAGVLANNVRGESAVFTQPPRNGALQWHTGSEGSGGGGGEGSAQPARHTTDLHVSQTKQRT